MEDKRKVKMNGYLVKITMNLFVEAENEKEAHWAVIVLLLEKNQQE
jgi:hypothetical protein